MAAVRILHLHSSFNPGGQETRTVRLMNHFGDQAEHIVLSAVDGAFGAADLIDKRVKVNFPKDAAPSLAGMPGMGRYRKLAAYMKKFHLVLSYNWGSMDGVMARTLLGHSMGLPPLIHHEDGFNHDEIERLKKRRNWFRTIALAAGTYAGGAVKNAGKNCANGMASARSTKSAASRTASTPRISTARRNAARFRASSKRDGEVVVGTIAGLRTVKNLPRLVRAVAAAGPNVRLAIAGEGPERDAIIAEAARLGIADRVMMPGFLRDPARYIGLFDIFALWSDSEQYPISLVEAMASGLPAVSHRCRRCAQHRVARKTGPLSLPAKTKRVWPTPSRRWPSDAELRAEVGEANRFLAFSQYDEETMFARYRQLYGSAMKRADFARQS